MSPYDFFRISPLQLKANMADFFYVLVALAFFVACWAFTKACDRL